MLKVKTKNLIFKNKKIKKYLLQLLVKKKVKYIKKHYKFKYKKPPWFRKSYKKFKSFIWLSKINLNFFFSIEDKYFFTKGFRLSLMGVWKKLYISYLQFFLGLPKKNLLNHLRTLVNKSRGFWNISYLVQKKLSFFVFFNLFKNLTKKNIVLNILNNGIIRTANLSTKMRKISFNDLFIIPSKTFFINSKLKYLKKLYKWYFLNKVKLRLWQKVKLKHFCKLIFFFNILKVKKKYTFFLLKNKLFFRLSSFPKKRFTLVKRLNILNKNLLKSYFIYKNRLPVSFKLNLRLFKKKYYTFSFFKKVSKKLFWLKKFFLFSFNKKKFKFISFFLYYFFLKKHNIKTIHKTLTKKVIKLNSWDFNLVNTFFLKKKTSYKNFNYKFLLSLKKNKKFIKKKLIFSVRKKDFLFFKPQKNIKTKKKIFNLNKKNKYTKLFNVK